MSSTQVETVKTNLGPAPAEAKGKLRYIAQGHLPRASPHNFHLPDMSEFGDERFLTLRSLRPIPTLQELPTCSHHVQLDTQGFTAILHPTPLHASPFGSHSFKNPELLKEHVIPNTADMLKQMTGCKTVITEALLLRSALWSATDSLAAHGSVQGETADLETSFPQFIGFNPINGGASPASKVHLDYTPEGARTHIRKFHPNTTEASMDIIRHEDDLVAAGKVLSEDYKHGEGPRWALYSIWRPLKTVKRDPLAVADYRTYSNEDYVPVGVNTPCLGRPGTSETHSAECYLARHSQRHKWYWIDEQKPEEALVLKFFDSDSEEPHGVSAGGVLHSSVELPGTEGEEARESLEIRCLCIW
ncbi:GA4 desaturase [Emericellopsis atlantica]|uniref:GA4 desaturase n=1 Tax=Emericellopsis atlantica TaxID=2614577 RepID=A0A9P8CN19_9HYPO|nr:GA4 desaturase [Emericellopsis atlantica]KAG9251281.1 GA4 desaturase [Emericellopsis atlantica]